MSYAQRVLKAFYYFGISETDNHRHCLNTTKPPMSFCLVIKLFVSDSEVLLAGPPTDVSPIADKCSYG